MNSQEQTFYQAEAEPVPLSAFVYLFTKVCCYLAQCYIIKSNKQPLFQGFLGQARQFCCLC